MKAIIVAIMLLAGTLFAQTNEPPVWDTDTADSNWNAFAAGAGIGLLFYGFGWKMRIARNLVRHTDV